MENQKTFLTHAHAVAVIATVLFSPTALATDDPTPDQAVAYLRSTRPIEKLPHPYPMFYHHHVAPHAVKLSGKIFLAYQDETGRPLALSYDITDDRWNGPFPISSRGLGKDSHGNPSLCVDVERQLHVFFGAHGGPLKHAVSQQPLQIDAWKDQLPPARHATYPQSQKTHDDKMALFFRSGGHTAPWLLTFSKNGESWNEPMNLIDLRRDPKDSKAAAYCTMLPGREGRSLHLFFIHKDDNATRVDPHPWRPLMYPGLNEAVYRYNFYYIQRTPDGRWTNLEGEPVTLPVSKRIADEKCLVYDSGDEFTFCRALSVDRNDRPYARFDVGVVDWARDNRIVVPWRTHFASPSAIDATTWQVTTSISEVPKNIRPWLDPEVVPVYDGDNGGISQEWLLRHEVGVFDESRGSHLFLGHIDRGWITRAGGPAAPPEP